MNISDLFVVAMGLITVFVVLILIIALCYLLSLISRSHKENEAVAAPVPESDNAISNRGELDAAVSAAIAEYSETDASAIRILSMKKI